MQASQEGVNINGNIFVELVQKVKGWFKKMPFLFPFYNPCENVTKTFPIFIFISKFDKFPPKRNSLLMFNTPLQKYLFILENEIH